MIDLTTLSAPLALPCGDVSLRNRIALAPMAGWTDVPFRRLAWRYGAGHLVSEMLSSKPELWDTGKSSQRRVLIQGVRPQAVQIAGSDPKIMAESAKRLVGQGVELLDINFGCPAKKVCSKAAGSALLADITLLQRIVEAVVAAVSVPVTVKTRTGLTPSDRAGLEAALAAQAVGAQMVVMHARSRACRFVGPVDYGRLGELRAKLDIPLLVNGDIDGVDAARRALGSSRADGVMIGGGAMGQPWIFSTLMGQAPPELGERLTIMAEHLESMHEFYGHETGTRIARKHIQAYLKRLGMQSLCRASMQEDTAEGQVRWLRAHINLIVDQGRRQQALGSAAA